jgi:hypothetical protein
VLGIEMLDQDKRHSGIRGQLLEKLRE